MPKQKAKAALAKARALTISNDPNKGVVTLKFDAPVSFMTFCPEDARRFAADIVSNAKIIERKSMQ